MCVPVATCVRVQEGGAITGQHTVTMGFGVFPRGDGVQPTVSPGERRWLCGPAPLPGPLGAGEPGCDSSVVISALYL